MTEPTTPGHARECLSEDEVQSYYAGSLSAASIEAVEQHADLCASCRALLSAVAPTPISPIGDRPPSVTALTAGMRIAERYRIVRLIARGGMGEVYEAQDEELGVRVALKTVGAVRADDAEAIAQLKREVSFARRVTHANVCRIFDFGTGRVASGGATAEITFLTMELLLGEPLSERIVRGTRLALDEVTTIARQIASALEAAHAGDVVHRDLKPSNVMLVEGPPARAVVTDFGLAREAVRPEGVVRGSVDRLVGTPEYMAPEQVEALPAGPPADIYAFGLILFELVTGQRPFNGPTRMAAAVQRLKEDAPSAATFVPKLPAAWGRLIARCLERRPEDRFGSATELARALATVGVPTAQSAKAKTTARMPSRWWIGGVALAMAALAIAGVMMATRMPAHHPAATTSEFRPAVAVIGMHSLAPDTTWQATAVTELLDHELEASETLRVLAPDAVDRARRELELAGRTSLDAAALHSVRQRLGCDWVIMGSVITDPSTLRVDLTLSDARSGEKLVTMTESGKPDALLELVARLGTRLRAQLGVPAIPASAWNAVAAQRPANAEAVRLYAEAIVHSRASDVAGAKSRLLRAIELEPAFPMTHAMLAQLDADSGLIEDARKEAALAAEHAGGLPREDRLTIEARDRALHDDWARAIEIERALFTFYPDELAYGLQLVRYLVRAGRNAETLAMIGQLRALPAPLGDDPRIDEVEAFAYAKQGDPKHRLESSEHAIAKAKLLGARIMVADNQRNAGDALYDLGETDRAAALYREAKQTFDELGDDPMRFKCALNLADLGRDRGDSAAARPVYEQAVAYYRKQGNEFELADKLNSLGQIHGELGDPDGALALYEESLAHFKAIGEREGVANLLSNEADLLLTRDDVVDAESHYQQANELFVAVGMHLYELAGLGDLGNCARRLGQFADAREKLDKALKGLRELGDRDQESIYTTALGDLEHELDHTEQARASYDAALAMAKDQHGVWLELQLDANIAQLLLDAHDAAGAAKVLSPDPGATITTPVWLAAPHAVLARAQLLLGHDREARELATRAVSELGSAHNDLVARVAAEVLVTNDCPAALKAGRANSEAVARHSAIDTRYEAELSLDWIEKRCGDPAATGQLAALAKRADHDGFVRIARLAREAR